MNSWQCEDCGELVPFVCARCGGCSSCCECSGVDLDTTDPDRDGYLWNRDHDDRE